MGAREKPIRVVQWTTGNVGKRSVIATIASPHLELVGCYAWSPDKAGRDVGELCGINPIGIAATNDINSLLVLKPDCVVYNPMFPNVEELVRILSAGINVVATSYFITGQLLGRGRDRIAEACKQGNSTIFGTGCNPGFVELFALVNAGICSRIDKITIVESADTTMYDSPETEGPVGFGRPMDDPSLQERTRKGTAVFEEALRMMAAALDIELDKVTCEAEYSAAIDDIDLGSWKIPKGCVAGIVTRWKGIAGDREIFEIRLRWKKGSNIEPDFPIEETYLIEIDGFPTIRTTLQPMPPADFQLGSFDDFIALGMAITAQPAINAIPVVVDAAPGILSYADLPIPFSRGCVS
jgi:hypothetical protein